MGKYGKENSGEYMNFLKKWFTKTPEPEVEVEEFMPPVSFTIVFDGEGFQYHLQCEDGYEELMGAIMASLVNGELTKSICLQIVEFLGKDRAAVVLASMEYYLKFTEAEKAKKKVNDVPCVLASRAFQNDSEIKEM